MTERIVQRETLRDSGRRTGRSLRTIEGLQLLRKLGEGATGAVYLADDPVHGHVALKLLRRRMETRGGIRRFEQEQRALALLDHPNIVRVLKASTAGARRRYFVMEYVSGRNLVDHCDATRLDLNARLRLFVQIGRALHHAEQRGVGPQGLKSENVLVARRGRRSLPKIIDFGGGSNVSGSPQTEDGSGVYFMGVLLYQLLVGEPPSPSGPPLFDICRETDRSPCSPAKLFLEASDPEAIALRRGTSSLVWLEHLHGPVSTLAQKCVAKDPEDRFRSLEALIRAVQELLASGPGAAHRGLSRARALLDLRFRLNSASADRV